MNHNGKTTLWWLIGLLTTITLGSSGAWLGNVQSQIRAHGEKIAVLETLIDTQKHQLDRMDRKLDRLLEREQRTHPE
jgi:hypothetical protein